jgi:hypothetical protein
MSDNYNIVIEWMNKNKLMRKVALNEANNYWYNEFLPALPELYQELVDKNIIKGGKYVEFTEMILNFFRQSVNNKQMSDMFDQVRFQ